MLTWDDAIDTCQDLATDTTTTTLVFLKRLMNLGYKLVLSELGRPQIEKTTDDDDIVTVADQTFYPLPMDCLFPKSVTVEVDDVKHPVIECEDQEEWDYLQSAGSSQTSDIPEKYFIRQNWGVGGSEVGLYPTPSTADYPIYVVYEASDRDLSNDVYETGTVTFTNGDATITGSGTTFTTGMVNRYIYCANDGFWYRLITFTDTTHMEIERKWVGTTTVGLTTNIREIFVLPEEMQILPVYFALAHYFAIKKDPSQESKYWTLFNAGMEAGKRRWGTKTRSNIIRKSPVSRFSPWAPRYFPSEAS